MSSPEPEAWWETLPARSRTLGRPVVVQLRDLPITEFALGMPELSKAELEVARTYGVVPHDRVRTAWDTWTEQLLARAIVAPAFLKDPAKVRALGEKDRDHLARRLLERLGMKGDLPYPRHFVLMVRSLVQVTRLTAAEVLAWPATRFWQEYRMLVEGHEEDAG